MRGSYLKCPGCGGAMLPYDVSGDEPVVVTRCQDCQGVWFDWFDGETSRLARGVALLPGQRSSVRAGGSCPRDGVTLEMHPYLDAGPPVARCPGCLGLWAGRSQLAALADFHERMPEASPEPIERASLLARLWYAFGR